MGRLTWDCLKFLEKKAMTDWQGFYTAAQVSRLTQIPEATLSDWKSMGIIRPTLELRDGSGKVYAEGYSYADMSLIRLLRALRDGKLDLKSARIALNHLYERLGPPDKGWADARVFIVGHHIYTELPLDTFGVTDATHMGQVVETRLFGDLFAELRAAEEDASLIIPQQFWGTVEVNPNVKGGQPVIKGTRLPTASVAALARSGTSLNHLQRLYPTIAKEMLKKAIEYEEYLDKAA